MPEGPEVKIITNGLNSTYSKLELVGIRWDQKSKYATGLDNYRQLESLLPLKLEKVVCRGKQIFFCFANDVYINSTLGISGTWINPDTAWRSSKTSPSSSNNRPRTKKQPRKHSNLWMNFGIILPKKQKGLKISLVKSQLFFNDPRHFGNLRIYLDKQSFEKKWNSIGPDLLSETVSSELWIQKLRKKNHKQICQVLMDQAIFSGIGNYLKAEILYASQVKPDSLVETLTDERLNIMLNHSNRIIRASYQAKGVSIRDYVDPDGVKGIFTLVCYNKQRDPLGNPVIKSKFKDNRTTHWVPAVQIH